MDVHRAGRRAWSLARNLRKSTIPPEYTRDSWYARGPQAYPDPVTPGTTGESEVRGRSGVQPTGQPGAPRRPKPDHTGCTKCGRRPLERRASRSSSFGREEPPQNKTWGLGGCCPRLAPLSLGGPPAPQARGGSLPQRGSVMIFTGFFPN